MRRNRGYQNGLRFRFYEGGGGTGGAGEGNEGEGGVDLSSPEVQKAVRDAVAAERARALASEKGLKENRDRILSEKKAYEELGTPEEVRERLTRLEEAENAAAAAKAGKDPEQFNAEVERVAAEKQRLYEQKRAKIHAQTEQQLAELQKQNEDLQRASHRHFVAQQLFRASLPEGTRIFQEGTEDILVEALAPYIVQHEVDGIPVPVARVQVNEALVPGNSKLDKLMDMRELLGELRQPGETNVLGRNLAFCFVSGASGSGSQTPGAGGKQPAPGGNWWEMTEEERTAYGAAHGAEAARELIAKSPLQAAAKGAR